MSNELEQLDENGQPLKLEKQEVIETTEELTAEEIEAKYQEELAKGLEVTDPEIVPPVEEDEDEFEEDKDEEEEEDLRDIIFTKQISVKRFSGDNKEHQTAILMEYVLGELEAKRISVVTEGCPCSGFLTSKVVRN